MPKPRLLIVLNRLSIGGPATNTLAVAHALKDEFDILLLAGEPVKGEESAAFLLERYSGFQVQKITSMKRAVLPLNDYHAYKQIKKIIKSFQPHIIHTHGSKPGVIARLAASKCNVPVIAHTYHGHVFHSYFSSVISSCIVSLERWLAKKSSLIIAINERLKNDLTSIYKIALPQKIKLNRLGIDVDAMQDQEGDKRKQFRTEFQLQPNEVAIGIVGRLVPVKQHHLFAKLAIDLLHANIAQPIRFFIIGDGDERQNLEQQFNDHQISFTFSGHTFKDNAPIVFTSWRKDMDVVMAGLDIVTLTSQNEGTPISVMEAMAAGKPVVAPDVGGIAELFQNNKNGRMFQQPVQLYNLVLELVQSEGQRSNLGSNARKFALQELTLQKQVQSLFEIYLTFLSGSTPPSAV